MLFIQASLSMGGVETFYVRMAKERHRCGQKTKILLISPRSRSNPELLANAETYADVYFLNEISILPAWMARIVPYHLSLLVPLLKKNVAEIFDGVTYVHTSAGFSAYLAITMLQLISSKTPITIGLYHSLEFCWGGEKLPYYERKNREMFFKILPKKNIIFFNEAMVDFYGKNFSDVNLFPLGVVDNNHSSTARKNTKIDKLLIGSVGRLVDFKSYNLWMLNVVKELKDSGIDVTYLVYGDGPLREDMQNHISRLGISELVLLKGTLDYSKFSEVVSGFDVFVGSGTAIVEASSLGVPSIIGIENEKSPLTYGYLSEIPGFSYNEDGLHEKQPVINLLMDFLKLSPEERKSLSGRHITKANLFSIGSCCRNFNAISPLQILSTNSHCTTLFKIKYSLSFFCYSLFLRLRKKSLSRVTTS